MEITPLENGSPELLAFNHPSRAQQIAKVIGLVAVAIVSGTLMSLGLFALGCPLAAVIPLGICVTGAGIAALIVFSVKKLRAQQLVSHPIVPYIVTMPPSSQSASEKEEIKSDGSDSENNRPESPIQSAPYASVKRPQYRAYRRSSPQWRPWDPFYRPFYRSYNWGFPTRMRSSFFKESTNSWPSFTHFFSSSSSSS